MGKKILLAWLLIILAIIAVYYQFTYQEKIRLDLNRVAHSLQVLALIYDLQNNLANANAAVRGYIISGDEQQLKQYSSFTGEISRLLTELTRATQEEPDQQRWLKILQPLINARLTLLQRGVELRRNKGFDAAEHSALASHGGKLHTRIWDLLEKMEDEEKKRFDPQWVQQTDRARQWVLALTISVVTSLSLIFFISYLFGLELHRRKESEAKLILHQEDLRAMASRLSLAEEHERHRIGAHLHDQIGQTLALANIKLGELLDTPIPETGSKPDRLIGIRRLLEQAIHETQSLTFTISSPILHEIGLEAALAWLTENSLRKHGVYSFFESDDQPKPVAEAVAILLYQIVAELLANVVKHARARHVKVSLWGEGDRLQVAVEDDGVGFEAGDIGSRWQEARSYGLFSIRERLAPFGGSLTVESKPGEGAQVTVSVPLETSAPLCEAS
jgi:signal transduction histidine kinase